jgi:hypothetical protein
VDVLLEAARLLRDRGLNFKVAIYGDSAASPEFVNKLKRNIRVAGWSGGGFLVPMKPHTSWPASTF